MRMYQTLLILRAAGLHQIFLDDMGERLHDLAFSALNFRTNCGDTVTELGKDHFVIRRRETKIFVKCVSFIVLILLAFL